jgi:hypothetical protein
MHVAVHAFPIRYYAIVRNLGQGKFKYEISFANH